MIRLRRQLIAGGVAAAALVLGSATAAFGSASHQVRHGDLLRSDLVGRPADPNLDVAIRGVTPGGAPWALSRGEARVESGSKDSMGRIRVDVRGLLITGTGTSLDGTTGPVKAVVTAVSCDGAAPALVTGAPVPLSAAGNARADESIRLPATCLAPVVLVLANSGAGPWIAAGGF
jgi:hypothetical protein